MKPEVVLESYGPYKSLVLAVTTTRCLISEGLKGRPHDLQAAKVEFHIDRDYLSAGSFTKVGSMEVHEHFLGQLVAARGHRINVVSYLSSAHCATSSACRTTRYRMTSSDKLR